MKITTTKKIDIQSRLFHLMVEMNTTNIMNYVITSYSLHFDEVYAQRIFENILALEQFRLVKNFTTYNVIIKKEIEAEELQQYIASKNYIVLTRSLIHIPSVLTDKTENILKEITREIEDCLDLKLITDDNLIIDEYYKINDSSDIYQYVGSMNDNYVFRLKNSDRCVLKNGLRNLYRA